jgi:hypothetical protein
MLQKFRKAKMGSLRKKLPKEAKALKEEALMLCNGVTFDFIAISKVRACVYQLTNTCHNQTAKQPHACTATSSVRTAQQQQLAVFV